MKQKSDKRFLAVACISVFAGMGLGTLLMHRAIGPFYQQTLADSHISSIMFDTQTATRLRENRSDEVARRLETRMPQDVLVLHDQYPQHPMTAKALRNIKSFYVRNKLPIPAVIEPILSSIELPASRR